MVEGGVGRGGWPTRPALLVGCQWMRRGALKRQPLEIHAILPDTCNYNPEAELPHIAREPRY